MKQGKPVGFALRRETPDGPLVGRPGPAFSSDLKAEMIEALRDSRNVLEEMYRIDLAHGAGFDTMYNERLARVDSLLKNLESDEKR